MAKAKNLLTEDSNPGDRVMVHLIDGTYELFRHFYGLGQFNAARLS